MLVMLVIERGITNRSSKMDMSPRAVRKTTVGSCSVSEYNLNTSSDKYRGAR